MKKSTMFCLVLVLGFVSTAFKCGRCEPPNCREVTVCDDTGWDCRTVRQRRFLIEPMQFTASDISNSFGIIDLANEWEIDGTMPIETTIKYENVNGFIEDVFTMSTYSNSGVSPVDSDTTPIVFGFDNPNAVADFLDSAQSLGYSNAEQIVTLTFSISQVNCGAPSGKYINHFRQMDGSGILYDRAFSFQYTASSNVHAGCNEGTIDLIDD